MSHFGEAARKSGGCTKLADRLGGGIGAAPAMSAQAWPAVHSLEGSAPSLAGPCTCVDSAGAAAAACPGPGIVPATNPANSSRQSVRAITDTKA